MKWLILTSAFAGAATAQGSGILPPCGQTCISNMIAQSVFLGCPFVNGNADGACLCDTPNFGYGIRDCANEACPPEHVGAVINYGQFYCQAAANVAASGQDAPTPAVLSILGIPTASPSPSESAKLSIKTDVADIVSTFTSGDSTITTTLQTSIMALATGTSDNDDSDDKSASDVRGHNKDNDDNSTAGSAATTKADAADATGGEDAAAETTTTASTSTSQGGVAPMITGALTGFANAPVVIAAAAVFLL